MATHGYVAADQLQALKAQIKSLTVDRLKSVLRSEAQTVSGVKSELQIRLISYLEKAQNAGNRAQIDRVRGLVSGRPNPYPGNNYPSPHTPQSSASPQQFYSPHLKHPGHSYNMPPSRNNYPSSGRPHFVESPFYKIEQSLTDIVECKIRETTRDTARIPLILPADVSERLQRDENTRVMVFCATENPTGMRSNINFPHQVELKCNGQEVKGNLRGLKNKPGSTKPADVTPYLTKRQLGFVNNIELVYALTNKVIPFHLPSILLRVRYLNQDPHTYRTNLHRSFTSSSILSRERPSINLSPI